MMTEERQVDIVKMTEEQVDIVKMTEEQVDIVMMKGKEKRSWHQWLNVLQSHRQHELSVMKSNFDDPLYHEARQKFVYHYSL